MNKPMELYRMKVSEMQRRLAQKATTGKHKIRKATQVANYPDLA